ncbi:MAG: class I SAM-dependent methyltransferase [Planctomycetota bacterium]
MDHETQARQRFDAWSESHTFQRLRPWLKHVQDKVLRQIDWSVARRTLDIACGSGCAVFDSARRLEEARGGVAFGCDISPGMLAQSGAEGGSPPNAHLMAASAQDLPFADNAFDAVICTAAFHHFPRPLHALKEIRRVLRPGGIVVITDTCRDQSVGTWIWDRLHRWFEPGHVKYYRRDELRSLFGSAGFQDVSDTELRPSFAETRKLVRRAALFRATAP